MPAGLKVGNEEFPAEQIAACAYTSAVSAQAGRNGDALLSGLQLVNVFVVNGQAVSSAGYELKLAWLDAFTVWLRERFDPRWPLLVVGDFNVAPTDLEVHDPARWRGLNLCSAPERARIDALLEWGLVNLLRLRDPGPGPFTFWDYREEAFHRGWGLRLDLALATQPVGERCTGVRVDHEECRPTSGSGKPSDHAPMIVTLT